MFEALGRWRDKEWLEINHEYHQNDFHELSKSQLEKRVLDGRATVERDPVGSVYKPASPTKERTEKTDRDYVELDERTAFKSRTYQYHMHGFVEATIKLTIDEKRHDQYLELMNVIAYLLAIENLQRFHEFTGIENIVEGMMRLIGAFKKKSWKRNQIRKNWERLQIFLMKYIDA